MSGVLKYALIALVAILIKKSVDLALFLDVGRVVYNHQPGPCSVVPGPERGSEDMAALPSGLVFISSGISLKVADPSHQPGQIFLYDLRKAGPGVEARPLTLTSGGLKEGGFNPKTFNPHGMDVWEEKGLIFLYVINHEVDEDKVEVFKFNEQKFQLEHQYHLTSSHFIFLNDLVLLAKDEFYVTNFLSHRTEPMKTLQVLLQLKLASLLYHSPTGNVTELHSGFLLSNSLALSHDKRYLYMTAAKTFYSFERNLQDPTLLYLVHERPLGVGLDNIQVDPKSSNLWIGSHPIIWKFAVHSEDREAKAPSQVLHLKMTSAGDIDAIEEVMMDDGAMISGSSAALHREGQLLVGSVLHRMLYCQIQYIKL